MLVHWIWLATRQGLKKRTQYELMRRFGDPEEIFCASEESLLTVPGMTAKALSALSDKSLESAKEILHRCHRESIGLLPLREAGYPRQLLGIYEPPVLLYYRGCLPDWESRPIIGAVGTRSCSDYGIRTARRLGHQLTRCGGCVVSGMAEGIDTAILSGVLAAEGMPVVFLAGGVDVIYPAENRDLYNQILSRGGCILSEQPPGTKPYKGLFPIRNRLISGISHGVLVVEAPEQSGALITARHAMEQGREVYAVPGPVDADSCRGSNALLKDGAHMAQSAWDILECFGDSYEGVQDRTGEHQDPMPIVKTGRNSTSQGKKEPQLPPKAKKVIDNGGKQPYSDVEKKTAARSPREQAIIRRLLSGPRLTDEVINTCGLPRGEALAVMTVLEIQGIIRRLPGNLMALNET
jgi:DNA processing protein